MIFQQELDIPLVHHDLIDKIQNILFHGVEMGNMYYCSNTDISCSKMNIYCFTCIKKPHKTIWHIFCISEVNTLLMRHEDD
jgi:hypothetical protein